MTASGLLHENTADALHADGVLLIYEKGSHSYLTNVVPLKISPIVSVQTTP